MTLIPSIILLILALTNGFAAGSPINSYTQRSQPLNVTLPISRRARSNLSKRQGTQSGIIGLGDTQDNAYSVQVKVGSTFIPVVFDTGSSDLWSITSDCTTSSCGSTSKSTPKIRASSLKSSGLSVSLNYGDSAHPTTASGTIGSGTVSVAGLQLDDQFLAGVDNTNTSLSDESLSGIFGIGFPTPFAGSVIFQKLLQKTLSPSSASSQISEAAITDAFISALPTQGPLISRLVANGQLQQPMFTVTLERENIEVGGDVGQLTIGQLPDGVSNDSLTWVPVRLYTSAQGGLSPPTSSPNEVYPARWEVPLDDVLLNGQKLPKPTLADGVGYTALIDSGTSFLAGPQNTVTSVYNAIAISGSSSTSSAPAISCTVPVDMTFVIGGKNFPVDPRDFLSSPESTSACDASSLLPTDAPSAGAMMSWILGDPFMKSNLVAFYYGNLTHPSVDPPRMGFLSTVPSNANDLFGADVASAKAAGSFVATSVLAPTTAFSPTSTDSNGVGQEPTGIIVAGSRQKSDALPMRSPLSMMIFVIVALLFGF